MVEEINYEEACKGLIEDNRILMEWLNISIKNFENPNEDEMMKVKAAYAAYHKVMYGDSDEQRRDH
jgi:hypothetical protein